MTLYYKLEGHKAVPSIYPDFEVDRNVATDLIEGVNISTIFLVVDYNHGNAPPILFETIILGGPEDKSQQRYTTWEEAVDGHEKVCEWVRRDYEGVL